MTASSHAGPGGLGCTLSVLAAEAGKGLQLMRRRPAVPAMAAVTTGGIYLMIEFLVGGGHVSHALLAATLPALFGYVLASTAAQQGSAGIAEEASSGTLDQLYLSPVGMPLLLAGRIAAVTAEGLLPAVALTAVYWAGFTIHYSVRAAALIPLALTVIDAAGYGLLMIALTMATASIGTIVHVFNMAIMFLGGMLVPVSVFPRGIGILIGFLPTALGARALAALLAGRSLSAAWAHGPLPWLLLHSVAISGAGLATYLYTIRRARQEGVPGPR
ncbi:MAG: ABC transporter permease [Actinobacteria bacterium]|nr:ABC transporter permease [Actinomycetota bacterium]